MLVTFELSLLCIQIIYFIAKFLQQEGHLTCENLLPNYKVLLLGDSLSHWKTKHTHTHTQPFYSSVEFVRDNPDEPVPE